MSEIQGQPISPAEVRYIKLGPGGAWARKAFDTGMIYFGYRVVTHDICVQGRWDEAKRLLADRGSTSAITSGVNEVKAFYELGENCLWVAIADGRLYWAFAHPEVEWIERSASEQEGPARLRRTLDGWRCTDTLGQPLLISQLSSRLTQTAGYRGTICAVEAKDYLLRKINGEDEPIFDEGRTLRLRMVSIAERMISGLHWRDFETLADVMLARSGWLRTSTLGGTQTDIDVEMEHPILQEKAFVQVKSRSRQIELDDYVSRFQRSSYDRLYYICHSFRGRLEDIQVARVHVLTGHSLADTAVRTGLFDWLLERSR
jgi:hypothetical protein